MTKRILALSRESLTELTTDELTGVAAAAVAPTIPLKYCIPELTDLIDALSGQETCLTCWCSGDAC